MPTFYVEDYEEVTGQKPEPQEDEVETKVIAAPKDTKTKPATAAKVK